MNATALDKSRGTIAPTAEAVPVAQAPMRRRLRVSAARGMSIVATTALLLLLTYMLLVRPWHMRWGATDAEVNAVLPGDGLVPSAVQESQINRAITIAAPAEAVWPWLVQLGQAKG